MTPALSMRAFGRNPWLGGSEAHAYSVGDISVFSIDLQAQKGQYSLKVYEMYKQSEVPFVATKFLNIVNGITILNKMRKRDVLWQNEACIYIYDLC